MPLETRAQPQAGLVSVIVPCYNADRFLTETLDSALAQNYPHMEIIVIDDGSTDRTPDIIRKYHHYIREESGPNRGASAARNRGTMLARGEFIQYLDADDLIPPDAVASRVAALKGTNADVAYSDWLKLTEGAGGEYEVTEHVTTKLEDVHPNPAMAFFHLWAPPAALTYRRTIVEKIGGWKEWLPIIQDARFFQDAGLCHAKFVHVPKIGASYRVHSKGSLSRHNSAAFVLDVFRNGCDLQENFERKGQLTPDERRMLGDIYDYAARSLFFIDRSAFHECLTRLYQVRPGMEPSWPKTAALLSRYLGFNAATVILQALTFIRRPGRTHRGTT